LRVVSGSIVLLVSWSTTYVAQADVLYHLWVEPALADNLLEDLEDESIERSVLEAALLSLGQGGPDGECDDDIVGVLGGAVGVVSPRCTFTIMVMVIEMIWGKLWRGVWDAYICSSGDLPGVTWERMLERRWVAIVRDVCGCCCGEQ
jgi:hypothetical protein